MEDKFRVEKYTEIFKKMIRQETVSEAGVKDPEKFRKFHAVLKECFPKTFEILEIEDFNGSLLMKWKGKNSDKPILLMSHHDVVAAEGKWSHDPFSAEVENGVMWGRGTLDTKSSLFAILQACEELIEEGYVPSQDVWIESGCNEETDGAGADAISLELQKRGIRFFLVIDEGGFILYDPIGGADGNFALVGVGEKGCGDLKFIARSNGGHASMPGKDTPLVRLGKFMADFDKNDIFEVQINDVTKETLRKMAPYMKGITGFLFKHIELFKPLLCKVMPSVSTAAGALLRTTLAFTMAEGSDGTNVLPEEAWVIGNMRYSHHQGQKNSFEAIKKLASKYDVEMEVIDPGFESDISDFRGEGFRKVEAAVTKCFPGVVTAPYVMTAASDCRFFSRVSDQCIRFSPFFITDEQLATIHGVDENIKLEELIPAVEFFKYIITN